MPVVAIVAGVNAPPLLTPGTHRVIAWMKYLPVFGWDPVVLAVPEDYGTPAAVDDALTKDLCAPTRFVRPAPVAYRLLPRTSLGVVPTGQPRGALLSLLQKQLWSLARWAKDAVLTPDAQVLWVPTAVRALRRLQEQGAIDAVLTTSPDNSVHLVGLGRANHPRLPWVADFRDPWESSWRRHASPFHRRLDHRLAVRVVRSADRITAVSPNLSENLTQRYSLPQGSVTVVTNGFDPDVAATRAPRSPSPNLLSVVHTGAFYGRRSPRAFLHAVSALLEAEPGLRPRLSVRFIGTWDDGAAGDVQPFVSAPWFELRPPVPHHIALEEQDAASVLLLIPGDESFTLPSKLFEYVTAGAPILALCSDESDTARFIRSTGAGIVAAPGDVAGIMRALRSLLLPATTRGPQYFGMKNIDAYSRREVVRGMASVLDEAFTRDGS